MKICSALAIAMMVVGLRATALPDTPMVVKSPDGRNELRLYAAPLSFEVLRDGMILVGKSRIDLKVNGEWLDKDSRVKQVEDRSAAGKVETPVYKRASVDLTRTEKFADFGEWGVGLVARNDGVAYRFETKMPMKITIDDECTEVAIPKADAPCWFNYGIGFGMEETVTLARKAREISTNPGKTKQEWKGKRLVYLPFVYAVEGKTVAITECNLHDYPIWDLSRQAPTAKGTNVVFQSMFARLPKKVARCKRSPNGGGEVILSEGGRWVKVCEVEQYLVKTEGARVLPWRTFIIADAPSKLCEADIVYALSTPAKAGLDFSWVRPGKVAWDWWNCFDNRGKKDGCNTKTYERFIDFAAKHGLEYVILDEGWSVDNDIWKLDPQVNVPHLIEYAQERKVGIILWMAWAQVWGCEEKVAEHFSKCGAKGFKVDFMDRGDAEVGRFMERFAEACARHKMLVDYHGVYRPTGLQRTYPNIINYEGVSGLEQMKWHKNTYDFMANDVREAFCRMTAGPMDYTPGAMLNFAKGTYKSGTLFPGSYGTRCRQMAMMALFEAPLQMLCDSPTNYERNLESLEFMAKVPTVWDATVGLGGDPDSYVALARKAKDGAWYVSGITNWDEREVVVDTAFLGEGEWTLEIFRDAADAATAPTHFVHETKSINAGEKLIIRLAPGGGFAMRASDR